ncbi:MAG: DUF1080 domain-containing protein [Bacteroidota bacterium]
MNGNGNNIDKASITVRIRYDALSLLSMLLISAIFFSCHSPKDLSSTSKKKYSLIFDGKTLDGWDYDPQYWRVENGTLVGEVTLANLLKRNSFIIKKGLITKDFDLKVEYRITTGGNSGINYRSETIDSLPYAMRGYQSDIDGKNFFTGQNYEERGRTTLAYHGEKVIVNPANDSIRFNKNIRNNAWLNRSVVSSAPPDSLNKFIKNGDWNECRVIVKGNRLLHYINGVLMSDVTDNDTKNRKLSGSLGVQVHVGPPMKIEYRNFRLKEL